MKHWDGRDRPGAAELHLSRRDRQRLRELFIEVPRQRRGAPAQIHSLFGLALAVGILAGLAWLLSPADPISSKLLH